MSSGVLALCRKITSVSEFKSCIARDMDMSGVIPLPAERNKYDRLVGRQLSKQENSPAGPNTRTWLPTFKLSCSQLETMPPGTRLTVMDTRSGRVGLDDSV